ncbi:MAG: hypothetical protein EA351_13425 [Gemmatimonadales bacterium]|nr:MAG: hypothetical protein EA351_13425 [Gemmatimonadales bacterium]
MGADARNASGEGSLAWRLRHHGSPPHRRGPGIPFNRKEEPVKTLFIVNHPPYGTEHAFKALRLANPVIAREDQEVRLFLQGDAALCAQRGQEVPKGNTSSNECSTSLGPEQSRWGGCSTCMDARGLADGQLTAQGVRMTALDLSAPMLGLARERVRAVR